MLVHHSYDQRFVQLIERLRKEYGEEMFKLEGIGEEHLDINRFSKQFFKKSTTADASIDQNANVYDMTVFSWENEFKKPLLKLNALYMLWKSAVEKHGIKRANKLIEHEIKGAIYIHDLHFWKRAYCYASSLTELVNKGMPFYKKIKIGPVKHFDSFINLSLQYICYSSNQIAGAVALPDFFVYADYFIRKDYGEDWYKDEKVVSKINQLFQNWIYSVNFSWRGSQSPFVNLSVMDKYWLEGLFSEHVNPDFSKPNLENVMRIQKLFVYEMLRNLENNPFTFPVMTACILLDLETKEPKDEEFLDFVSEVCAKNGLFNIYTSDSVDSLSSCCFTFGKVKIKEDNQIRNIDIKDLVCRFIDIEKFKLQKETEIVIKGKEFKKYANILIYSYNFEKDIEEFKPLIGVLCKKIDKYIKIILSDGTILEGTPEQIIYGVNFIPNKDNKEYQKQFRDVKVGEDVIIYKGKMKTIKMLKVIDIKYLTEPTLVYDIEVEGNHNYYLNSILVSNCRLRNSLETSKEYINSFGSGGINIGSHRVCTINLPQIAYEVDKDFDEFMKILEYRINIAQDILEIHRETIQKIINEGAAPLYTYHFMELSKQFSTIGFIGLYEALELLGTNIREKDGQEKAKKMLGLINEMNEKKTKLTGNIANMEQVPGESASYKLAKKDALLFENSKYKIYSNQYIPLINDADLLERIKIHGMFDRDCSGGSILHLNCQEQITKDQAKKLIKVSSKNGVVYFALNYNFCQCQGCGKVYVGKMEKSPCHNAPVKKYIRVVGFLTEVANFAEDRRIEYEHRKFYKNGNLSTIN